MEPNQLLQFRVLGYTGIDVLFSLIYTYKRMAKRVARKAMRTGGPFADAIPGDETRLLLILPDGAYRVLDEDGTVEVWAGQVEGVGL